MKNKLILLLSISLIFLNIAAFAQDLAITPKRVFLDQANKNTEIELINNGDKTLTYRIKAVVKTFDKFGRTVEEIDGADANYSKYFRFSPKLTTLAPKEKQTVRIMGKGFNKLDAEKVFRLSFVQVEEEAPAEQITEDNAMGMNIQMRMAITIPVILTPEGVTPGNIILDEKSVLMDKTKSQLSFIVRREGASSAGTDVEIVGQKKGGSSVNLGKIRDLFLYSPQNERVVVQNIPVVEGVDNVELKLVPAAQ